MTAIPNVATIARDATWLPHRYDPGHDSVHFVKVTREGHRAATFLTDEQLGPERRIVALPRREVLAALGPTAPIHFLFHSAFCCSTLLARALDVEGAAMSLKEPVILNDMSGWRRRGAQPRPLAAVLDNALTLLARPFEEGESIVVKPSNVVNAFAPAMLAMRPEAGAILLHAPLRIFVGSVARKGMWGRLWVRDLLAKLLDDQLIDLGFEASDYLRLTDLQAAAVGWLAQHQLFARLADQYGARVRTLDSETLLAYPEEAIAAAAKLYGLCLDQGTVERIAGGPVFTSHSKLGAEFDAAARAAERETLESAHLDEIEKVVVWADAVAANAGVALRLGSPLLA